MIDGAHAIIYSKDADADRSFLRDVLKFSGVDVGGGWTIFGLPPAEIAVHPAEESGAQEVYLMCDDVNALVAELAARGVACSPVSDQRWGLLTHVTLPGGGTLGVYEPRHARPAAAASPERKAAKPRAAKRKAAKRKAPERRAAKRKAPGRARTKKKRR
jgi:hypothetical protein